MKRRGMNMVVVNQYKKFNKCLKEGYLFIVCVKKCTTCNNFFCSTLLVYLLCKISQR